MKPSTQPHAVDLGKTAIRKSLLLVALNACPAWMTCCSALLHLEAIKIEGPQVQVQDTLIYAVKIGAVQMSLVHK